MNGIAVIILITIIADAVINTSADVLNLRMLRNEVPESFRDVYDADRYHQSQEYLRVNTRFRWITGAFDLTLLLIFWFGKGFPLLDQWVRYWHQGPVISGIIYMGVLVLLKGIISLPFIIYDTFVIEAEFGFNKTTWQTFMADLIKGLAISIVLGTPLLAGILAFFAYAGASAWWYCWAAVTVYMLGMQFIAPAWIMPLFNKFDPLEDGELKSAILSYSRSVAFPLKNVFVMDGSRRSEKSNAFFTGFGKNRRIALFDTLISRHTVPELVAVLAHEIGHYKKKHILQGMILGIAQTGLLFFLLSLFISYDGLFEAFYMKNRSVAAGLIFFSMLYSPIDFFSGILMRMFSRKNEYEADRFAVETVKDHQAMSNALKKLSAHNLSNLTPHPFYVFLNYSHPPVQERIRAIAGIQSDIQG